MLNVQFGFEVERKGTSEPWMKQVHSAHIVELTSREPSGVLPEADSLFTRQIDTPIHVYTADCVPLLLANPEDNAIAAVHAGWRGASLGIVRKTLSLFRTPEKTRAMIGPCILVCCFEVKGDFVETFRSRAAIDPYLVERGDRLFFDLIRFIESEELRGVFQIDTTQVRCTHCSQPTLPSYRRDKVTDPHLRSWIRLSRS